jgi:hypothetical protein
VSRPGLSLPSGKTRYPLYRRLGGPQSRSGQVRKILPPPGFDPRTVQPIASRYTDCATRSTMIGIHYTKSNVFLLLFMYFYCYIYVLFLCAFCMFCFHRAKQHSSATLTEGFRAFSSLVRQMPRYNSQIQGMANTLPKLIVLFYVLFVCKCVLYHRHRMSTQLQLANISISIMKYIPTITTVYTKHSDVLLIMLTIIN